MAMPKGTIETLKIRFWAKVLKTNACWLWLASTNEHGYGKIRIDGRNVKAHRVAWTLLKGVLPVGVRLLHKCDNPACVNPDHLFPGTQIDNIADMRAKGRHAHGETSYAKITEQQALAILRDNRSQSSIAKEYGLCQQSVSLIKRGVNWSHLRG